MALMDAIWLLLVETYIAFARHFVATLLLPTFPPYKSATGIGYTSKNYLEWQAIQLAIHSIVGNYIDHK